MRRSLVAMLLAAVAACGGATEPPIDIPTNTTCSVALTGAQTSNLTCTTVSSVWATSNNRGSVGINITGGNPTVTSAISFNGEPAVKTYRNTDADAASAVTVTAGTSVWLMSVGGAQTPAGTYTLTLTSVSQSGTVAEGKAFTVHGTLDATLPAVPGVGGSGVVTFKATF